MRPAAWRFLSRLPRVGPRDARSRHLQEPAATDRAKWIARAKKYLDLAAARVAS